MGWVEIMLSKDFDREKHKGQDVYLEDAGVVKLYDSGNRWMTFSVDHAECEWSIRHATPSRYQLMHTASIMESYKQLGFRDNQKTRNNKIERIKKAIKSC